ncbi:hypothetical protein JCM24511_08500 [Saitozyma sp. JCM 24511]|nr:hypothetical protein JCM24511_08500 [Saitozyma sp. JCM 24511]
MGFVDGLSLPLPLLSDPGNKWSLSLSLTLMERRGRGGGMIQRCDVEDGGGWVGPKNGTSEAERGDDDVEAQRSKGGIVSYRIGGTLCSPGSGEAGAKGILKGRQGKGKVQTGSGRSTKGRAQAPATGKYSTVNLVTVAAPDDGEGDEERRGATRKGKGWIGGWAGCGWMGGSDGAVKGRASKGFDFQGQEGQSVPVCAVGGALALRAKGLG